MPNHCDADMKITGPSEPVAEFLAKYVTLCDGTVLDLDRICPYPQEFKELDRLSEEWGLAAQAVPRGEDGRADSEAWSAFIDRCGARPTDGFNSGGYEWCITNWGTKWGCYQSYGCDTPLEKIEGGVILHFSTAWSPFHLELLQQVSAEFPSLRFKYDYYERGAGFQGHAIVLNGKLRSHRRGDYRGSRGG